MPQLEESTDLQTITNIKIPSELVGDPDFLVDSLDDIKTAEEHTLTFWSKNKDLPDTKSMAIVVPSSFPCQDYRDKNFILTDNPRRFIACVMDVLLDRKPAGKIIHPTAVVHPDTILKGNVIIEGNVVIREKVEIGNNCVIKAGAVIGGQGFGFERGPDNNWLPIPSFGGVKIGDDVYIGSNTCIDSGTFKDTVIGDGTKIDNLVHVGHNSKIGKNCIIIAMSIIGGGVIIEDDVWVAPSATIRDNVKLGSQSFIALGAVVTKSVPSGVTVAGVPAKPFIVKKKT